MRRIFTKKITIFFLAMLLYLAQYSNGSAEFNSLPQLLVGQLTATSSSGRSIEYSDGKYSTANGLADSSSEMTVNFWLKVTDAVTGNQVVSAGRTPGANTADPIGWNIWLGGNPTSQINFQYSDGTSYGRCTKNIQSGPPLTGNWYNITIVKRAGYLEIKSYKTGEESHISTDTCPETTGSLFNSSDMYFGDNPSVMNSSSAIKIDDFKIYNAALTNEQIIGTELYPSGSLKVYYDFDNNLPPTIYNVVGASNNMNNSSDKGGTLNNDSPIAISAKKSYGGMAGNFSVLNGGGGNEALGFNVSLLSNDSCAYGKGFSGLCFVLKSFQGATDYDYSGSAVKLLTSTTRAGGIAILQTPVLFYGEKIVSGDVYGSLDNFAFWGRNLHQSKDTTTPTSDATWKIKGPINTNAQASWSGAEFSEKLRTINTLAAKGQTISASDISTPTTWYLQSSSELIGINLAGSNKYPEGKVWVVNGDLTLTAKTTYTYSGRGTIIVKGYLTIDDGAKLVPSNQSSDSLGIIVLNKSETVLSNITASGNNNIEAVILGQNSFTVNDNNSTFVGSFVAKTFSGMSGSNIRFFYDYDLDENWPPGFRSLNMPTAKERE